VTLTLGRGLRGRPTRLFGAENAWAGYCGDVAIALGEHLTSTLNHPVGIELVELTSTLQNRFDLVRDGSVHLECGPNTIRQDMPGITFSIPFYVTGAKFLVRQAQAATVNFNLPGLRLGVFQDTITAAFVRECYPNADIVTFAGANDREQAVQAVVSGAIEAFIGDSVLSEAELQRQNLPRDQFALLPENPLTCEYYGLILPDNDPQWRQAVNEFLQNTEVIQADFDQDLRELDYCFNR
jgi:ABC-type amino acid transport substrate-binding protein